jgi:hypothetical protein
MFSTGKTTATVNISNDGLIGFGGEAIVSFVGGMSMSFPSSKTSYTTTGTSPSRIFKLEYRTHGLSNSTANNDSISYQMWLYESIHKIEWHFGPNYYYSGSFNTSPLVLLVNGFNYYNINGNPSNPQFTACGPSCHLQGIPSSGTVYALTPVISGLGSVLADKDLEFLFLSEDKIEIKSENEIKCVSVISVDGKKIRKNDMDNRDSVVELNSLPSGIYVIQIETADRTYRRKIVRR